MQKRVFQRFCQEILVSLTKGVVTASVYITNLLSKYMFQDVPVTHSLNFNGQIITLQTGLLAQQASATVMATLGETTVLAAVVIGKETQNDYFPLQVIYEECMPVVKSKVPDL
jgi:hypothetical protein